MHKSNWTNVLSLLAVMVIVDGRVYKNEVDTFVSEAVALDKILNKETSFTTKLAFDWFVTERDEIKTWCKPDGRQRHIVKHVLALREHPHRKDILASMHRIALSDDEFHLAEVSTLLSAAKEWRLEIPTK